MNKAAVKKYGTLLLLACGAGFIFQLPFIRETFYIPIQNAMGLTNAQMGSLNGWYAIVATPAYFLGGIVADKFSPKLMLTFSFLSTGLLGLWFSFFPGYDASRLIFALMGFTTVMTYWSSVIKAVRMLGDSSEQGRLFGLQEGLRGFLNAGLVFVMAAVYASFADNVLGAAWAIRLCAVLLLVIGVLGGFLADKIRSRLKVIAGAAGVLALSWAAFIAIPVSDGAYLLVLGNFLLGVLLVYAIRSQYFADIDDAGIDVNVTGRVSGILSTFGYLPDVFIFSLAGGWIDSYAGKAGYDRVFLYAAAMGALCVVITLALLAVVRRDKRTART